MKDTYLFYTDQLQGEYKEAFDQVEMYVSAQRMDSHAQEEHMSQLLDTFLSAQEAGRPVKQIVGSNMEKFCKTFCSDCGWKNRLLSFLEYFKEQAWLMLVFACFDMFAAAWDWLSGEMSFQEAWTKASEINVSGYLIGICWIMFSSYLASALVRWAMFKSRRVSMKALRVITWVIAIVAGGVVFLLLLSEKLDFIQIPATALALGCGIYLAVYYWATRKRREGQKPEKVRFSDMVREEMEKSFPEEMEKDYQRASRRSIKRGKGPLTREAYLEKKEKDCRIQETLKWFYYLLPLVVVASGVASMVRDGDEGIGELLIYVVGMLAVEYPIMIGLWKLNKGHIERTRAWIQSQRESMQK